jgi:hypothetical protein
VKANLCVKMVALAALFGFFAATVHADDKAKASATGTWKWTRKTPNGSEQELSADLKQDGEKLTGKVTNAMGSVDIKDGKVKDGKLTFTITIERNGNEFTVQFSGKQDGDKIKGKVEYEMNGEKRNLDWEPKREKKDK